MTPPQPGAGLGRISRADRSTAQKLLRGTATIEELVLAVAGSRRRPITLLPHDTGSSSLSGVWVATPRADYIAYDSNASPGFKNAIICSGPARTNHN